MINWQNIKTNKTSGKTKTVCPVCSHTRKKKSDKCLSVDLDKGVAKCWNCDEISFRERNERADYKLPNQSWINHTKLSDKLVNWFKNERNISQQTLMDCKITEETHYQPALSKNVNNIVFNYFEGKKLINKKYRSGDKKFTQTAGTKKILYGLNDIIGQDEIYIVEGEMDKLALWEVGVKNCVSVPNGAKDLDGYFETCKDYLKDLKKVFIAVDEDDAGKELELNLIRRFGKWRCAKIHFQGEKDANDLLKLGVLRLQNSLSDPKPYPVGGTFTADDVRGEIMDYYHKGGEKFLEIKSDSYKELNKNFKIAMGQLTVVTGIPSHGKSNFIECYIIELIQDYNFKASFYSPEHFPMPTHHSILAEKIIGKPWDQDRFGNTRMTPEEVEDYIDWSSKRIFITYPDNEETMSWKWLLDKFKEQLFRYGINIFVIDAFNKVKRKAPDSLGEINDVLSDLTAFVQAYNVHVFLVAHPTKMQKNKNGDYNMPTLYDVKGTGDFRDQAHNGLCIYRDFNKNITKVVNLKTKLKGQGIITGVSTFKFDQSNGRFYSGLMDRLPIYDENRLLEIDPKTVIPELNDADVEDLYEDKDLPF